jgi:integrase
VRPRSPRQSGSTTALENGRRCRNANAKISITEVLKAQSLRQAFVKIGGRERYLGLYGSPESYRKYRQFVIEWTAERDRENPLKPARPVDQSDLRVCELIKSYLDFAEQYYRKDGRPTGELPNLKEASRQVVALYAVEKVVEFGPSKLKMVREAMISAGLSRKVINARVNRIRRISKWGVENEMVPPTVLQALQAITPLKPGRSAARETQDVKPVPAKDVEAVRAIVGPQVRAMIDTQLLTGMRPGELVSMRPCDIDRKKPIWSTDQAPTRLSTMGSSDRSTLAHVMAHVP